MAWCETFSLERAGELRADEAREVGLFGGHVLWLDRSHCMRAFSRRRRAKGASMRAWPAACARPSSARRRTPRTRACKRGRRSAARPVRAPEAPRRRQGRSQRSNRGGRTSAANHSRPTSSSRGERERITASAGRSPVRSRSRARCGARDHSQPCRTGRAPDRRSRRRRRTRRGSDCDLGAARA